MFTKCPLWMLPVLLTAHVPSSAHCACSHPQQVPHILPMLNINNILVLSRQFLKTARCLFPFCDCGCSRFCPLCILPILPTLPITYIPHNAYFTHSHSARRSSSRYSTLSEFLVWPTVDVPNISVCANAPAVPCSQHYLLCIFSFCIQKKILTWRSSNSL